MKAYFLTPGPAGTGVALRETATPEPKPGEILVRVRATSLNRGELLGGKPGAPARAGGGECAGEVVKVGEGVTGVSTGDRMMGRCAGGFAEYAVMDAREAMRVPGTLAWEEAAATPLVFVVVYDMLVAQGQLAAGQWLLVTGVSSGVGVAALQTGKVLGAPLDLEALHSKRLTVFGVSNRLRTAAQRAATVRGFVKDVLPYFEDGRLRPLVDRTFGFDELPAAIKFMESDAQVGKIVVRL